MTQRLPLTPEQDDAEMRALFAGFASPEVPDGLADRIIANVTGLPQQREPVAEVAPIEETQPRNRYFAKAAMALLAFGSVAALGMMAINTGQQEVSPQLAEAAPAPTEAAPASVTVPLAEESRTELAVSSPAASPAKIEVRPETAAPASKQGAKQSPPLIDIAPAGEKALAQITPPALSGEQLGPDATKAQERGLVGPLIGPPAPKTYGFAGTGEASPPAQDQASPPSGQAGHPGPMGPPGGAMPPPKM